MSKTKMHAVLRRGVWVSALLPPLIGLQSIQAQVRPGEAVVLQAEVQRRLRRPRRGETVFHDPSPRPTRNNLGNATYVGYKVCAGCHGRLTSTRRDHTIIDEWENTLHAKDGAVLRPGLNVYSREVTDGIRTTGPKLCGACHTTGAPTVAEEQSGVRNGFDPSQPWNEHTHNVHMLRVQCESCHGPASNHVLSGGDSRLINRIPDSRLTCYNCHASTPNEKGNVLTAPATDGNIARYSSSLSRAHNAGNMIAGAGGYEYAGEDYTAGHGHPHTRLKNTCVGCHALRDPRSPILDHSTLAPKIEACRSCHGDARGEKNIEEWPYVHDRRQAIRQLLIRLGGATSSGDPDNNAAGGLLGNAADKSSPEYSRARWNYSLVINDGSLGVHNFSYALQLLPTSIAHAPAQKSTATARP